MRKFFISILLVFGLVAVTSSCVETATNDNSPKTEEVKADQSEASTSHEPKTVMTSKGTYNTEMVLKRMYKLGFSKGKEKKKLHDKAPSQNPKSKLFEFAESDFKKDWTFYYGEPKDEGAQAVYEKARQTYLQGWEKSWE